MLRTMPKAIKDIQAGDPKTDLTLYGLRQMVKNGELHYIERGNRKLINMEELQSIIAYNPKNPVNAGKSTSNNNELEAEAVIYRKSRFEI